jgi:hypothetical protein
MRAGSSCSWFLLLCASQLTLSCVNHSSDRGAMEPAWEPRPAVVKPHWEQYEGHPVYVVPDPRDRGEDRSSRVTLGADLQAMRQYTLHFINGLRARYRRAPLVADPSLDTFAQEGSILLALDHRPHHHFEAMAASCGCGAHAENQGAPFGWAPGPPDTQIAEMLSGMMDEGPGGGHHDALLSPEWRRLGVGILNPGGRMYFTLDFGR